MDFRTNPYFNLVVPNLESKNYEQYCVKRNVARNLRKGKDVKNAQGEIKFLRLKSDFFLIFE